MIFWINLRAFGRHLTVYRDWQYKGAGIGSDTANMRHGRRWYCGAMTFMVAPVEGADRQRLDLEIGRFTMGF